MSQQKYAALPLAHQNHYLRGEQLAYFQSILTDWRKRLQVEYSESRQRIRY